MPQTAIFNLLLHHVPQNRDRTIRRPRPPPSTSSLSKVNTVLTVASKLPQSAISNAPNTAVNQAKQARDQLRDVQLEVASNNRANEEPKNLRTRWTRWPLDNRRLCTRRT